MFVLVLGIRLAIKDTTFLLQTKGWFLVINVNSSISKKDICGSVVVRGQWLELWSGSWWRQAAMENLKQPLREHHLRCFIRTTTGNRVFGALKGALDGGIDIPHSEKRFAGFNKDGKQIDAEVHRKCIYGGHVASYMRTLMEDEPEKYQTHFPEYVKARVEPDNIEELYKKVHAAICADPTPKKSEKQPPKEEHKSGWKL